VEKKSDKPVVELFVMSYCPYGTQMEKGIIPVVETLGNKIDFKLKFVSYTMHGDKENQENLRQYCIDKDQFNKFTPYLQCFLGSSDSAACLKSTGDEGKVTSCMVGVKQFDVTGKNFSVHKAENDVWRPGFPDLQLMAPQSNRVVIAPVCLDGLQRLWRSSRRMPALSGYPLRASDRDRRHQAVLAQARLVALLTSFQPIGGMVKSPPIGYNA
jgi:hypothetical protein